MTQQEIICNKKDSVEQNGKDWVLEGVLSDSLYP